MQADHHSNGGVNDVVHDCDGRWLSHPLQDKVLLAVRLAPSWAGDVAFIASWGVKMSSG